MKEPQNLQAIDLLQTHFEQHPLVGKTFSLVSLLKRMNYVMHENDPTFNRIPNDVETVMDEGKSVEVSGKELISQYLLLYENSGGDTLPDVINAGYTQANVQINLRTNSSYEVGAFIDEVLEYQKKHFPPHLKIKVAGPSTVLVAASREIISGQMRSFVISIVLILGLLSLIFSSPLKGVIGVIPLVLAIGLNFGIMGIFDIPLDIGTSIISSIAIGVGVDYSIHYLTRLLGELKKGMPYQDAMLATIRHIGKAIVSNAATVGIGFLALLFSEMLPITIIGWMVSLTMLTTCVGTLVVIPATLNVFRPKFLFDAEKHKSEATHLNP